jgi:phosphatidylserine/phosphatidylglycerophosphate/cardiolipin synthase-like enzyme
LCAGDGGKVRYQSSRQAKSCCPNGRRGYLISKPNYSSSPVAGTTINAIRSAKRSSTKTNSFMAWLSPDFGSRHEARAGRRPAKVFNDLAETPGVEIRIKRKNSDLMHLKSYQTDGRLLRTGAANFSASGLKRQDNDLIVIESAAAAAAFKHAFDVQYDTGEALAAGAKR